MLEDVTYKTQSNDVSGLAVQMAHMLSTNQIESRAKEPQVLW